MTKQIMGEHGCLNCLDVNKGYHMLNNGQMRCDECGGVALTLQQAFDFIGELQSEVRALKELLGE